MTDKKEETKQQDKRATPDEVIARQRNRQLMIITTVIAVLALGVWITRATKDTEQGVQTLPLVGGTTEEPAFDQEDVTNIQIWRGDEKLELRKEGGGWRVPARYNVPADKAAVGSLLTKVFDGRRLNRPATTAAENYVLYQVDDASTHLMLGGAEGKELLHLVVGQAETGGRTFVRYLGDGSPEGIYEVIGAAGQFDSLHSQLKLTPSGAPEAKRWLDLSVFEPLPFVAIAQRMTIRDGDRKIEFAREPGSDTADDKWEMISPRRAKATGTMVRGVIDGLMNFKAADIAGPVSTKGAELGVIDAKREVVIEYTDDNEQHISRLYFGKQENGQVAVLLKAADRGEYVYWCPDYSVSRMFRPTGEFLEKKRVQLLPDGVPAQRLSMVNEGIVTTVHRDDKQKWRLAEPFTGPASESLVNGVMTSLTALQGYTVKLDSVNRQELKLGPGYSERWIEVQYKPTPDNSKDEDGAQDTPEGETQPEGEVQPEGETPPADGEKPAEPALKSARLYFGTTSNGEVPVLRVVEGEDDQVFWLADTRVMELFPSPRELQDTETVGAVKYDDNPTGYVITDGERVTTLTKVESGWQIAGETPVNADDAGVGELLKNLRGLTGIRHEDAGVHASVGAGPEQSSRSIKVLLGDKDDSPTATLWFGNVEHDYVAVLSRRTGVDDKLHWVQKSGVDALFGDAADYRKLEPFKSKVRQVLISWKGKSPRVTPKDPERTREQALALVEEIISKARAGSEFIELQRQYNEDSVPDNTYDVSETAGFVKPFTRLAADLKVGEVGYCESEFGFHILKRIE